jgi:DNA mismatch repair protein MutS
MTVEFRSILYPQPIEPGSEPREAPDFFADLHLDRIVNEVTASFSDYDITAFYYAPLSDSDAISYRHEVMKDMELEPVAACVVSFTKSMRMMRSHLGVANDSHYKYENTRWFLNAVQVYCEAMAKLARELSMCELTSRGMLRFRQHLVGIVESDAFRGLAEEAANVAVGLAAIRYCLVLKESTVVVMPYDGEADYTASVEETFGKFRREPVRDYRIAMPGAGRLNHVDAQVLEGVARLNPHAFAALEAFAAAHSDYLDVTIARFDNEIQFYLAYLNHVERMRRSGLAFCYPELSTTSREEDVSEAFDLALASTLAAENIPVVCNDWVLREPERIIVVTGPNQGGKTTFARMFGQLHYLARLGCPVPGVHARLFLCDRIFVHFERDEDVTSQRGKLMHDLIRVREILDHATPASIVVMNEVFAATTVSDALVLSRRVMARLSQMDLLAVCVTFLDELASFNEKTVSMVGGIDERDPAVRTFRLHRKSADGMAYAVAIARKYGLDYAAIMDRTRA